MQLPRISESKEIVRKKLVSLRMGKLRHKSWAVWIVFCCDYLYSDFFGLEGNGGGGGNKVADPP